jgi:DNA-binding transcriptional MocR family regulator
MTTAMQTAPGGYGHPAGTPALRRAIAHWVGRSRAVEATADQIIITAGAQQGIDLVTRLLVASGQVVAIEDPGYPPAAGLFAASGAEVVPVPVDADGIVVARIPAEACMVYTTPSHQSPTGVTMSMARRRELLHFAEDHNVAIFEDDYEYRHSDRPLEPLHRLDVHGRVIYVGTFSKTLSPSLRLGFVVLPESLVSHAIDLRSLIDWQPPATLQATLLRFIVDGHLDRHPRRTRKVYSERHQIVGDFVGEGVEAGLLIAPNPSHAGLHVTPLLPAIQPATRTHHRIWSDPDHPTARRPHRATNRAHSLRARAYFGLGRPSTYGEIGLPIDAQHGAVWGIVTNLMRYSDWSPFSTSTAGEATQTRQGFENTNAALAPPASPRGGSRGRRSRGR